MKWKHIILASFLSLVIGATTTWYIVLNKIADKQDNITACQERVDSFCGGQAMGDFRLTQISCNEKQEVCVCGDSSILRGVR
jgi:hypothetical protein